MKTSIILIVLFSHLFVHSLFGIDKSNCSLHKKETKAVHRAFGENTVTELMQIPEGEDQPVRNMNPGDCIYTITDAGKTTGYLLSTRAKGRYDYFDYCIIYTEDLTIIEVVITVYRSTQGAAVSQKGWLSQFKGYNGGILKLGPDIDAVSGGTISASSIVQDIQRCQQFMSILLSK